MIETETLIAHAGARMALSRKTKGASQTDFANAAKVTLRAYQNYESGRRNIPSDVLVALSIQFNINVQWLMLGKDTERQETFEQVLNDYVTTQGATLTDAKRDLITEQWTKELAKGRVLTSDQIHTWLMIATQ